MTPEVTIVLPVRDAERTLPAALESCLRQTFERFELLVVVNGSSDRSERIAREFAAGDPRVQVLESSAEEGVAGAHRLGMEHASALFLARMDADDFAYPERIGKQLAFLEENEDFAGVSCGVRLLDPVGEGMERYVDWVNDLVTPEAVARERFVECPIINPSTMLRTEFLRAAEGYRDAGWAEDHDLWLRMLEGGARFGKVPDVLLVWRDSATRLTRTHPAYAEVQVWRMKAHYLARLPGVRERGVAISGAGPIGKRLARLLGDEGVTLQGFFEVHPRRIGERIGGVEVAGPEHFGTRWREAVLLSAVGVEGGREQVRDLASAAGYVEGEDFWCCC